MTRRAQGPRTLTDQVAEEIRVVMTRRRILQTHLAKTIGCNDEWLSVRLTGKQAMTLHDVMLIAAALEVPVADLMPEEAIQEVVTLDDERIRSHPLRSKPARHDKSGKPVSHTYMSRRPGGRSQGPIIRSRRRRSSRIQPERVRLTFHRGLSGNPIETIHAVGGV